MEHTYNWDEAYLAAIVETDYSELKARIGTAQAAIDNRLLEVNAGGDTTPEERYAVETALAGLAVLRNLEV